MLKAVFTPFLLCLLMIWSQATALERRSRHARTTSVSRPEMTRRATSNSANPGSYSCFTDGHSCQESYGCTNITGSPSSPKPSGPSTQANPTVPVSGSDQDRWLASHNKIRAQYDAPALTWDETLEAFAKQVTDKCVWKHTTNNQYGENLAAGQPDIEGVVKDWVDGNEEKGSYTPSSPAHSHFSQVVWRSSARLGCAMTSCSSVSGISLPQSPVLLYVCEYDPPGNVEGQYAENVKALQGGAPAA